MVLAANFFEEPSEQSRVKAAIVAKYFWAWAKVIMSAQKVQGREQRVAYVDLFAGPGRYADGTPSTPIRVLEKAIKEPDLRQALIALLNDKDGESAKSLRTAVFSLPGIATLSHKPQVSNEEVGERIVGVLRGKRLAPTLLFVDPWGYKGLTLDLIGSVLKDWGCDCVFFFNYNRVNAGLNNPAVREHMDSLFGAQRAESIRNESDRLDPREREALIVEELSRALGQTGANFVLPFAFRNERGTRTSHHLIFASKSFKGYEIMKAIMAGESTQKDQGVASFLYSPASKRFPTLFELTRPMDDLEEMLLVDFAGEKLSMRAIYEKHSVGKPYIEKNYKNVLAKLEAEGMVSADPPAVRRRRQGGKVTFAGHVMVTFPKRGKE